jgi:hypothetical protein
MVDPTYHDSSAEIRARAATAATRLEGIAKGTGPLDYLDTLASLGLVEHELEIAASLCRQQLRAAPK